MGIEAIYRRPNTSKPAPGHKIYPYLLRGVAVVRPNQDWATDITYIPMARGFVYLVAVVDWFTRRVLSHLVSITMEASFCIEALEEAIGKHGKPEIFNSHQGSQFTSEAFDRRIAAFDAEFVQWAKENEDARRLTTIPGFGWIVASALVAAVGHAESFDHGRDLAAWLGLVPRQCTTGGKPKLLGISMRGNKYLRKQLIRGARAALPHVAERDTRLGRWTQALMARTITMWRSSPSQTSWRESLGRSFDAENQFAVTGRIPAAG